MPFGSKCTLKKSNNPTVSGALPFLVDKCLGPAGTKVTLFTQSQPHFIAVPAPAIRGTRVPSPFRAQIVGTPTVTCLQTCLCSLQFCCWQGSVMAPGPGSSHAVLVLLIDHDPWSWLCPHVCTSWWEHRVLWACPPQKSALFLLLPDSRYRNTLVLIHCLNGNDEGFALKPRHGVGHPWTHPWKLRKPTGACLELNQMLLFYSCI